MNLSLLMHGACMHVGKLTFGGGSLTTFSSGKKSTATTRTCRRKSVLSYRQSFEEKEMLNQGMMLNGEKGAKRLYEYTVTRGEGFARGRWYVTPTPSPPPMNGQVNFCPTNISIPPMKIHAWLALANGMFVMASTSTDARINKDLWFFCAENNSQTLLKVRPRDSGGRISWVNGNAPMPFPLAHGEIIHCYIGTVPYK